MNMIEKKINELFEQLNGLNTKHLEALDNIKFYLNIKNA